MANDPFHAAEAHWLAEPSNLCDRCWEPVYDDEPLCWRCEEDEYEAELQATEGNEETAS